VNGSKPRGPRATAERHGLPVHRLALGASIGIAAALLVGCASATAVSGPGVARATATAAGSVDAAAGVSGTAAPGIASVARSGRHWKIGFDLAPTKVVVVNHPNHVLCGTGSARCSTTLAFTHKAACITVRSVWTKPAVTTKSRIGSACSGSSKATRH
jgi:hypothetical protein